MRLSRLDIVVLGVARPPVAEEDEPLGACVIPRGRLGYKAAYCDELN